MSSQFGPTLDVKLNEASDNILKAEMMISEGTILKDAQWPKVIEIFEEFPQRKPRFIADNGHTLALQTRSGRTTADWIKFESRLFEEFGERKGKAIMKEITTSTIDASKVEVYKVRHPEILPLIAECVVAGEPVLARTHGDWTKDDQAAARALGINQKVFAPQTPEAKADQILSVLDEMADAGASVEQAKARLIELLS